MHICLIGFSGAGKSKVGKLLSRKIKIPFIDLDQFIENKLNYSIDKIFHQFGESFFREKEFEYLSECLEKKESYVIATGGGACCSKKAMSLINNKSFSIYLKAEVNLIFSRLIQPTEKLNRPLLKPYKPEALKDYIKNKLVEREKFYQRASLTYNAKNIHIGNLYKEIKNKIGLFSSNH